ncbi:MAG: phenylalanine--tRNA ligase subunit beta [Pseudomonadota bacterium]
MKLTLGWLQDHLETEASLKEITDKLSMIGLEVEAVQDQAEELAPFTVARVLEAKPHPNADRLRVCQVESIHGVTQVVCGAPNARTGMIGVFAPSGSYIPGTGVDLKAGVIRGEESNGMLVSEREMGISDEHDGIIDLPADTPFGAPFATVAGLDDPMIEIAITPNRGDCLGVRGVARDLAAAGLGTLKPLHAPKVEANFDSPIKWRRDFDDAHQTACPYVAGRSFRNVKNGPSPAWMQQRLRAIGLRPISALVDVTNYVSFDLGRPLHVFDADKLQGDLTMRMARDGEAVLALDGESYELSGADTVIGDEAAAHAIGGVMGGENSGCSETTTNVFLEVALFDPDRVASTGRRLGIHSDARYRFERGLDPDSVDWGVEVGARLILELCGGEASEVVTAGENPKAPRQISYRPERTLSLGGVDISTAEQSDILERLGFAVSTEDARFSVTVPSWRPDVECEACLVEEVMRIHGFDAIPQTPLARASDLPHGALTPVQRRRNAARMALTWRGMTEAVTYSFLSGQVAALFGEIPAALRLVNPISADLDVMRPSVLPNLVGAAARNQDRGLPDGALFEVGPQYRDDSPEGQSLVAAGVRAGQAAPRHWSGGQRALDAFDAKSDALAVLAACGAPVDNLQVDGEGAPGWYHPGRSGALRLGPNILAYFGEVHPKVLRALDLKSGAVAFEAFIERVPQPKSKGGKLRPAVDLSPFQPVSRDFAFLVDQAVSAEKVVRAAKGADKALITAVDLFDSYSGKGVEPGHKSLAIAVTLQPTKGTMTDEEIDAVSAKVIAQVEKATGGSLRS